MKNHIALVRRIVSGRGHLRRKGWTLVIANVCYYYVINVSLDYLGRRSQTDGQLGRSPIYDPVVSSFSWAASEKTNNHFRLRYALINEYLQYDSTSCACIDAYYTCIDAYACIAVYACTDSWNVSACIDIDTCECIKVLACTDAYAYIDAYAHGMHAYALMHMHMHWCMRITIAWMCTCIDACACNDVYVHAFMYVYMHWCMRTCIDACAQALMNTHALMHTHMHWCMRMHLCIHMYWCIWTCIDEYACIATHTCIDAWMCAVCMLYIIICRLHCRRKPPKLRPSGRNWRGATRAWMRKMHPRRIRWLTRLSFVV